MAEEKKTMAERMGQLEEWRDGHEDRCADRQKNLLDAIGELKDSNKTMRNAALAALLAILGFAGAQLYNGLKPVVAPIPAIPAIAPIPAIPAIPAIPPR